MIRLGLFVILLLATTACQSGQTTPDGTVLPQSEATPEPATTAVSKPAPAASSTSSQPITATPASTQPAVASPTWPIDSLEERCGILLPLADGAVEPAVQQLPPVIIPSGLVPDAAQPALQRILDAPGTVGLAAFQIGQEGAGVYLNADSLMPLASVVKVINLIAYAETAGSGLLDPAEWIPLSELERYYLPGSDLRAHNQALSDLEELGLIAFDPPATPLEEIPAMMIRRSSNAASDYLHMTLGQETIEQTIIDLGLSQHTASCPFVGQFLAMSNRSRTVSNNQAVQGFIADPESYGREAMRLTHLFANDETFRAYESTPRWQQASVQTQSLFSDHLNAQSSAREYAQLMARILQNQIGSPYVNILVRRYLEWPMAFTANQELFSTVGYKNGSLPGVLTTVYYAQRLSDGAQVVVALFYRQLPRFQYQDWRRNLPHDEFARWLLSDPQAIPAMREILSQ